jgi:hypothetical protein
MHHSTHMQGSSLLSTQQWHHTAEAAQHSTACAPGNLDASTSVYTTPNLLPSSTQLSKHMLHKAQAWCCHMCCSQITRISHHQHHNCLLLLLLYYRHTGCHTQGPKQNALVSAHKPPLS